MSKAKFAAARELIREGKLDEARAILRTVDHPKAAEWLAKLESASGCGRGVLLVRLGFGSNDAEQH